MAKYIFLQYLDESKAPRPGTPEMQQVIDAFATYLEELQKAGAFHEGDACQPSARPPGWPAPQRPKSSPLATGADLVSTTLAITPSAGKLRSRAPSSSKW